ncbi:MAG: IreB family regulatory phosphoprotein [Oscillospiraceae bacterium]|jgi:uncharacterized protein (UPF0297 family)|nr:IreB family regulatory phosphoprotein [Oscillospiraceae bacterium]
MDENTKKFSYEQSGTDTRATVKAVFEALRDKGYNPVNQLVGYILTEDPTYITTLRNARSMICRIDRDELLSDMVKNYVMTDK